MYKFILLFSLFAAQLSALEKWWKPTSFLWGYGIAFESDTCPNTMPAELDIECYRHVKRGDIVWIHQGWLYFFQRDVLPHIHEPFILVMNMSDETFPTYFRGSFDVDAFIEDPRIHHIFAQNCDIVHPKVTSLPIGIDFHTRACSDTKWSSPKHQEKEFNQIRGGLKSTRKRIARAFVDFQHHDTLSTSYNHLNEICGETRGEIFEKLIQAGCVDYKDKRIPRVELWRKKGRYAFSVSPPGNGWDAHRTWEDLALGCIVIVKSSPLDPLFDGLPVVIVKEWSEITKKNLKKWQKQYGDAFDNPHYQFKLTHAYWMAKIKEKQRGCLNA